MAYFTKKWQKVKDSFSFWKRSSPSIMDHLTRGVKAADKLFEAHGTQWGANLRQATAAGPMPAMASAGAGPSGGTTIGLNINGVLDATAMSKLVQRYIVPELRRAQRMGTFRTRA